MKLRILAIALLLAVAGGGWFVLDRLHAPAHPLFTGKERQALLSRMLNRDPALKEPAANNTWITYRDRYLEVGYPEAATVITAGKSSNVLSQFQYRMEHTNVGLQLSRVEGLQGIREYPGVAMRLAQADTYGAVATRSGAIEGLLFTKSDGLEETAFFFHEDTILIVSVSGTLPAAVDAAIGPTLSSLVLIPQ